MTADELDAGIAFVLRHGAGTSRDVIAALVEKCDRLQMMWDGANSTAAVAAQRATELVAERNQLTSRLATLQKCYDMLQEGLLLPLLERDRELKQECRRLRDENAALLAKPPEPTP